jgi:hypothetical protein
VLHRVEVGRVHCELAPDVQLEFLAYLSHLAHEFGWSAHAHAGLVGARAWHDNQFTGMLLD